MNNKNKRFRFNFFDVMIILLVLAVVGVMYYYTTARNSVLSNTETTIEYVVELKTVKAEHINNIIKGDKVVETVRDQQIGEVVKIDVVPSYSIETNMITGESYISTYPDISKNIDVENEDIFEEGFLPSESEEINPEYDYYNVRVTVRSNVKKSDNGYKINGFDVIVGELVHFRVPKYVTSGYCISINEIAK